MPVAERDGQRSIGCALSLALSADVEQVASIPGDAVAAVEQNDFSAFHQLMDVLAAPCDFREEFADFLLPPGESDRVFQTFCGT